MFPHTLNEELPTMGAWTQLVLSEPILLGHSGGNAPYVSAEMVF